MNKCIAFEIWGDFGHFRKFYTTSSPLTHAFPPKTAIWGMIGAIIGLEKNNYLEYFQTPEVKCSVRINSPIIKTRMAVNLIDTKVSRRYYADTKQHTQISIELLKRPRYKILFYHPDSSIYLALKNNLEKHLTHYTLCLGLSEFIAQFRYIGEIAIEHVSVNNEMVRIASIIPTDRVSEYEVENNYEYFKETAPAGMDTMRRPIGYQELLYERKGQAILCNPKDYYRLESGENVLFL